MTTEKTMDIQKHMQIAICEAPGGNGICISHMPDFLKSDEFDDSAAHVHYFYEIIWFRQGYGKHFVDFQEYEITPNTLIFLTPGQVHHFDSNSDYEGITIKMNAEFMRNTDAFSDTFLKYTAFHSIDFTPCYHIDQTTASQLSTLIAEMEEETDNANQLGEMLSLKSLVTLFIVKVLRNGTRPDQLQLRNKAASSQLFIRFRMMVDQEYMHIHTVQDYADRLNVSVRTLNKCTNLCAQVSPLVFINRRIILEAKRIIRYSDMMIKEVAYALGYDDVTSFIRLFKRETGFHPTEFRDIEKQ